MGRGSCVGTVSECRSGRGWRARGLRACPGACDGMLGQGELAPSQAPAHRLPNCPAVSTAAQDWADLCDGRAGGGGDDVDKHSLRRGCSCLHDHLRHHPGRDGHLPGAAGGCSGCSGSPAQGLLAPGCCARPAHVHGAPPASAQSTEEALIMASEAFPIRSLAPLSWRPGSAREFASTAGGSRAAWSHGRRGGDQGIGQGAGLRLVCFARLKIVVKAGGAKCAKKPPHCVNGQNASRQHEPALPAAFPTPAPPSTHAGNTSSHAARQTSVAAPAPDDLPASARADLLAEQPCRW